MMAQWSLDGLLSRLPKHRARTLLIAATADRAVPAKTSQQAARSMPDAKCVLLNDLGHLAHEEAAATVHKEIETFLAD